eukprot:gene2060-biopygen2853
MPLCATLVVMNVPPPRLTVVAMYTNHKSQVRSACGRVSSRAQVLLVGESTPPPTSSSAAPTSNGINGNHGSQDAHGMSPTLD